MTHIAPTSDIIIKIDSVSFKYPKSKNLLLKDINLQLNKGDRVGIRGGNGSGKSTLLKLIFGIYPITKGKIVVNDRPVSWQQHLPYVGYIGDPGYDSHSLGLPVELRVEEIIDTVSRLYKSNRKNDLLFHLSSELGLNEIENRFISNLSTGERKRLMTYLTFVKKPSFIILDEPFDGLDVKIVRIVEDLLNDFLSNPNNTMLFISHSQIEIETYCSKIYNIYAGNISLSEGRSFEGEISSSNTIKQLSGKTGKIIGDIIKSLNHADGSPININLKSKE